jgi:hypothetical protein
MALVLQRTGKKDKGSVYRRVGVSQGRNGGIEGDYARGLVSEGGKEEENYYCMTSARNTVWSLDTMLRGVLLFDTMPRMG